jgi:AAA family ATP:ADP antiporter
MGILQTNIGIASFIMAIAINKPIIKKYGWKKSATITPIMVSITSTLLLFSYWAINTETLINGIYSLNINTIIIIGIIHTVLTKALKYCLTDTTKEMSYIQLDELSKTKGKAAVDVVGARVGKSGASWLQIILIELVGNGSLYNTIPLFLPFIYISLISWIYGIKKL